MDNRNPMHEDPEIIRLTMMLVGADAIKMQERRGQQDMIHNDVLPRDMRGNAQEDFERLGFIFGEGLDDVFVACTYPEGWSKQATDHSMWSNLLDTNGSIRARIFYKAAFYDRSAFISLSNRYKADHEPQGGWLQEDYRDKPMIAFVEDRKTGTRIWQSEPMERDNNLRTLAVDWLEEHYPHWQDIHAYWDDESDA